MARSKSKNTRLVYSTDQGRVKPESSTQQTPVGDGTVRVQLERKGRGGKTVTAITGVPLAPPELKQLGKQLKQRCGTGGSVKDGLILIQGDHCDTVVAELKKAGYNAKRSGG